MRFSTAPRGLALAAASVLLLTASPAARLLGADSAIRFNRDIRPILADNCLSCHGPDPGSRKAGLRLDTKEGLFGNTKKEGPVVTPSDVSKSALLARIAQTDPDEVMPPPKSHKTLTPEQKERLKTWVSSGAAYEGHWSFIKPERPEVPLVKDRGWVRNPIDAFILARLEEKGLKPAPEADRRTLARRLSLDLTGLPPEPKLVEAFVKDRSPKAYENLVHKLMDSPQWGEHRARYWLDAARYSDTHGMHFDNHREMWPYRDWVVRAFNCNMAFDRFTIEQLAGDLLPEPTQDQLIATGFQRCNLTTNEGGTIEEENQVNYANDRVTTFSWVWLGLTGNCAACHDHKFDPITQRDFYSMAAFFRNTTQGGYDGNVSDSSPSLPVFASDAPRARWKAIGGDIDKAREKASERRKSWDAELEKRLPELKKEDLEAQLASGGLAFAARLEEGQGAEVKSVKAGSAGTVRLAGLASWKEGRVGQAPRFEDNAAAGIPIGMPASQLGKPSTIAAWVTLSGDRDRATLLAQSDENASRRGWELYYQQDYLVVRLVSRWPDRALSLRTKQRVGRRSGWQHLALVFDGSGTPEGIRVYTDGNAAEVEVYRGRTLAQDWSTSVPVTAGRRFGGAGAPGAGVQDLRVYSRVLLPGEIRALAYLPDLGKQLQTPFKDWKDDQKQTWAEYLAVAKDDDYRKARLAVAALEQEREGLRLNNPWTHIQEERKDSKPMAQILSRGQYDKPKEKVDAATPAALHPMAPELPRNRLGLAQWVMSAENPLTARVTVNRFWQELFGAGIVRTSEDFGAMGTAPSNQALMDWLAVEFRESGWDVKHLFELLVTSSAYRQGAVADAGKIEADPGNRLISRGPRFRMDAEMVRDQALSASGLLVRTLGGESVRPYQPEGVWETVGMRESNTRYYEQDFGQALYRRSMYTYWKRSAPPALMDVFNAPSRETCTVRRERTNTPLQALATLNDEVFLEASRVLAEAALRGHGMGASALNEIARRVLARPLRAEEVKIIKAGMERWFQYYRAHPEAAKEYVRVGESKPDASLPAPKVAALSLAASQILNLDEALTK